MAFVNHRTGDFPFAFEWWRAPCDARVGLAGIPWRGFALGASSRVCPLPPGIESEPTWSIFVALEACHSFRLRSYPLVCG